MDLPQPEPDSRLVLNHETGRYLRLGLREFDWLNRLDGQVHESGLATLLGIEESMALELLRRLTAAKLICSSEEPVKLQAIQPAREHRNPQRRIEWTRFGQLRIHLLEPNALLDRVASLTRFLMNRAVVASVMVASLVAFAMGVSHGPEMGRVLRTFHWGVVQILTMAALFFFVTCAHEVGHAAACRHFGAPVRSLGVMLYYLQPAAYADVTDSWQLRNRWDRVAISSAGVYVQALLTSASLFLWTALTACRRPADMLVMFIVMNVTTIFLNVLPFVRLDGYWILSNALPMNNLRDRSLEWVKAWFGSLLTRRPVRPERLRYNAVLSMSPMGRALLFCFGVSSIWFGGAMWAGGLSFLFRVTGWLRFPPAYGVWAVVAIVAVLAVVFAARSLRSRRKTPQVTAASPEQQPAPVTAFVTYAINFDRPVRLNPHVTVLDTGNGTFTFAWSSPEALTLQAPRTLFGLIPLLRDGSMTVVKLRQSEIWLPEFENVIQRLWHHRYLRYSSEWELTEEDLRFSRQLGWFSLNAHTRGRELEALQRLRDASVTILGVGGLGTHVAWNLASCGIGELHLVDADRIEMTNLNRQLFFTPADIGRYKVDVAAERLLEFNPQLRIRRTHRFVRDKDEIGTAIQGSSFVVRALDSPVNAIILINEVCVRMGIPFTGGGFMAQGTAVGATVIPGETSCLACTPIDLPQFDRGSFGTLGPMVSATAGLLATEVIIHLAGLGAVKTAGRMLYINVPGLEFRFHENPRNANCSVCGSMQRRVSA